MPSPIAHAAAGYAIYALSQPYRPQAQCRIGPLPESLLVTGGFSLLPDIDSAIGLLVGDFGRFHNNLTHGLFVGLVTCFLFASLRSRRKRSDFVYWFAISLLAYEGHVLMDSAGIGRGVLALWPFTSTRYHSPIPLFYGLHWSDGWISPRHLWTVLTEIAFTVVLIVGARRIAGRASTQVGDAHRADA